MIFSFSKYTLRRPSFKLSMGIFFCALCGVVDQPFAFGQSGDGPETGSQVSIPFSTGSEAMESMNIHPLLKYNGFLPNSTGSVPDSVDNADFHRLLKLFADRYGTDDNFTSRVTDNRDYSTLEISTLKSERQKLMKSGISPEWDRIDKLRANEMNRLVDKWQGQGIPNKAITITWGRLNQVFVARKRDEPYIEYELRLARRHGLSSLATELGTVETFNNDYMISSVGASSRYQFMPDHLRRIGVHQYKIKATNGKVRSVNEERNPLFLLEEKIILLRAYANAVGHEIPGISSYNTGPANIYNIYRKYLRNADVLPGEENVADAFAWGLTKGFDIVSKGSSFKRQSRAFFPSVYGAFRAIEHVPINFSKTMEVERLTMKARGRINLSTLLATLRKSDEYLYWGYGNGAAKNFYDKFRALNPHISLPRSGDENESIPKGANLVLTSPSNRIRMRIFLPIGSLEVLKRAGHDVFDESKTTRFDDSTFADPAKNGDKTLYDYEYENLVKSAESFDFTTENYEKLKKLKATFLKMAEDNPSSYRIAQAKVIKIHVDMWSVKPWRTLARDVTSFRNRKFSNN